MATRIVAVLLAASLALSITAATDPAQATKAKNFKKVVRSFQNDVPIVIGDDQPAGPYPSTIQVGGFKRAKITDVNLNFFFGHPFPNNVDVLLVAPNGRRTIVMSDAGDTLGGPGLLLFNDEVAATLPEDGTIFPGAYRPTNFGAGDVFPLPAPTPGSRAGLSLLDRGKPNGTLKLFVVDDEPTGVGNIDGWQLDIVAKVKKKKRKN